MLPSPYAASTAAVDNPAEDDCPRLSGAAPCDPRIYVTGRVDSGDDLELWLRVETNKGIRSFSRPIAADASEGQPLLDLHISQLLEAEDLTPATVRRVRISLEAQSGVFVAGARRVDLYLMPEFRPVEVPRILPGDKVATIRFSDCDAGGLEYKDVVKRQWSAMTPESIDVAVSEDAVKRGCVLLFLERDGMMFPAPLEVLIAPVAVRVNDDATRKLWPGWSAPSVGFGDRLTASA